MEKAFQDKLKEDRLSANRLNSTLSQRQYNIIISKVIAVKGKETHTFRSEHFLLEKYDVQERENKKRLIVPNSQYVYYVHDDELFSILMETHLDLGHGDRDQMMKKLKTLYKNISYKDIILFLSVCTDCVTRKQNRPTEAEKRSAQFNNQCLIHLVDYQSFPDGDFNFVMVYQELFTKFSMLKPLKSMRPEEVADNLINVFGILGPPAFLQSNYGIKFVDKVIEMLKILWPSLEIARMKAEDTESPAEDVESLVTSWMRNNKVSKWSEGIRFVQLKKNTTFNSEINMTPYEALFKYKVKTGARQNEESRDIAAVYKKEPQNEDEYEDENDTMDIFDAEVKEEPMEICKTEPKTICGDCGQEIEDEEGNCFKCNSNESREKNEALY